jgi:hypothetical protein
MTTRRHSSSPLGTITHRPGTALLEPRTCRHGHYSWRYAINGLCVVCQKQRVHEAQGRAPGRARRIFNSYDSARARHEDVGGFLLQLESGRFLVTTVVSVVVNLRGLAWAKRCDAIECWDEVELAAREPKQ